MVGVAGVLPGGDVRFEGLLVGIPALCDDVWSKKDVLECATFSMCVTRKRQKNIRVKTTIRPKKKYCVPIQSGRFTHERGELERRILNRL